MSHIIKFLIKTHVALFVAMFFAIHEEDMLYVAFACLVMPIITYYLASNFKSESLIKGNDNE